MASKSFFKFTVQQTKYLYIIHERAHDNQKSQQSALPYGDNSVDVKSVSEGYMEKVLAYISGKKRRTYILK